ncbi:MAG: amidase [Bryobacterales bacterium]|nr:amidase [Bryobacterales bacterium]
MTGRRSYCRRGGGGGWRGGAGELGEGGAGEEGVASLDEVSLTELAEGLSSGRWNSVQLVEAYMQRALEIDSAGPMLRSILEVNPDARDEAWRRDEERRAGRVRGRLHGIPILVKDNIATAGRMMTTAGSLALMGWRSPVDAHVVRKLRGAGAVILGKTNLSEWANFRSTKSTSGWSGRGGQTRNPYAVDRNPSGSSSGSAVAAAASLCAASIGTETDGSIVSPASVNGIVGIKPTVGLVSRSGIIPIAHSQDTAGPMARCVMDATILLDALAGEDAGDEATLGQRGQAVGHYTEALDATALRGARLGVVRSFMTNHAAVEKVLEETLRVLRDKGATVVEVTLEGGDKLGAAEFEVLLYEFKADLERFLAGLPEGRPRTLAALIEFNKSNAAAEMPWFGQEIFELAAKKGPLTEPAYQEARRTCLRISREEGIDAVMAKHSLNALVGMTDGPAWPTDWINGDHFSGGSSTWAAVAGYPHVTAPAGFVHGLPVGFSFIGKAWSERELVRLAGAFEHATEARRKPRFLAKAV